MKQKQPTSREASILRVLEHGECYGLEIRSMAGQMTSERIPLGSLYVTLDRMEAAGLLASRNDDKSTDAAGNRRRYYRITGEGRKALKSYLSVATAIIGGLQNV